MLPIWLLLTSGTATAQNAVDPGKTYVAAPVDTAAALAPPPAISTPKLSGYVIVRERLEEQLGATATVHRVRTGVEGTLPQRFGYRLLVEYQAATGPRTAAGVSLRDAIVRWSRREVTLSFGQMKTPFTREYVTSITAIETAERAAVVDTLATKRDIGLMVEWSSPARGAFAAGVFNGEGQNASANRDSSVLWVARALLRALPFTTLGGSVAAFASDSTRYGLELTVEAGGALLRGELVGQRRPDLARDDLGWYVLSGIRARPWLQLIAKQEDFQRPARGVGFRIQATTLGANADLPGGRTRLMANAIRRTTGAARTRSDVLLLQAQVRF